MDKKRRSKALDKVDTPGLRAWKLLKPTLTEFDKTFIKIDCAHDLAAADGFCDEPARHSAMRRNTVSLAIAGADARSMVATGKRIVTIADYKLHKLAGDPGTRAIYDEFHSWQEAKNHALVGKVSQPGVTLLRTLGVRKTSGPGVHWSFDVRVEALATFRELRSPYAYALPYLQYEEWRSQSDAKWPQYSVVIGQIATIVDGKECLRKGFSWKDMNDFAEELALREPETYPKLAERARLARGIATS